MSAVTITAADVREIVERWDRRMDFCKRDVVRSVRAGVPGWYAVEGDPERENPIGIDGLVSRTVDQMVRRGQVTRLGVRREWDQQGGHAVNMFGGAGVMQRRRAYFRVAS